MKWYKLIVETTTESIEAVSEILNRNGANGVEIQDAADFEHVNKSQIGPFGEIEDPAEIPHLQSGATVAAYYPQTTQIPELIAQIQSQLRRLPQYGFDLGAGQIRVMDMDETDWANAWKKYYQPTRVTRFLTVVPQWEDYTPKQADEAQIILDPGMSFGTGTHPTTILALTALEQVLRGGEIVFDVGTGSGILSLAASKMGAKSITACDLDQVAVQAALDNLNLNPSVTNVTIQQSDLLQQISGTADLILANILAEIINVLIPDLDRHLKPKGKVILAGIIEDKRQSVLACLAHYHFQVETQLQQGQWVALIVSKLEAD